MQVVNMEYRYMQDIDVYTDLHVRYSWDDLKDWSTEMAPLLQIEFIL